MDSKWQVQRQIKGCQLVGVYSHHVHINEKSELYSPEFVLHIRNLETLESWYWKLAWLEDENLNDHLVIHEQQTPKPLEYTVQPLLTKDFLIIGSKFNFNDNVIKNVIGYGFKATNLEILTTLVFEFDKSYLLVQTGPVLEIKYVNNKPNVQKDVILSF